MTFPGSFSTSSTSLLERRKLDSSVCWCYWKAFLHDFTPSSLHVILHINSFHAVFTFGTKEWQGRGKAGFFSPFFVTLCFVSRFLLFRSTHIRVHIPMETAQQSWPTNIHILFHSFPAALKNILLFSHASFSVSFKADALTSPASFFSRSYTTLQFSSSPSGRTVTIKHSTRVCAIPIRRLRFSWLTSERKRWDQTLPKKYRSKQL